MQASISVDIFKSNLEKHKAGKSNCTGNYWELSDEIFRRVKDENRSEHISFLREHPFVAKRKGINLSEFFDIIYIYIYIYI